MANASDRKPTAASTKLKVRDTGNTRPAEKPSKMEKKKTANSANVIASRTKNTYGHVPMTEARCKRTDISSDPITTRSQK
ncbi:Hypothetical protein CINCED_3A003013 [Cinara cedri]|uniref:Uncharacterized protein n=1 Tax=Cinara cedri TaxID=506608 RepID=A0A5E4NIZ5_9HEMI|nr:Hypothetical protein CINCED_3A003013 [Cinara cedri]